MCIRDRRFFLKKSASSGNSWGKDAQLTSVPLSPDLPPQPVDPEASGAEYIFTYDVTWEESAIRWASRWDLYLYMGDDQIHWFSIINSLAIVLLLTGIVAMIMMRTLRRDFNRYNEQDKEDLQEESGWKLVHADVFRPPQWPILLCCSLGTGMQLLAMSLISIFCAMLGFLSFRVPLLFKEITGSGVKSDEVLELIPGSIGAETYCGPSGAETAASKCAIVSWRESAAGSADSGTSSAHARLSTLRGERPAEASCSYCASSSGVPVDPG